MLSHIMLEVLVMMKIFHVRCDIFRFLAFNMGVKQETQWTNTRS